MKLLTYILAIVCLSSFSDIPKNFLKKIDKEVFNTFEISSYDKENVVLDKEVIEQMTSDFHPEAFFKIISEGEHLGYFYFGKAPSKADVFDYVVIFDKELVIKKIKILAYREDWGGEITSKRWLRQFNGASQEATLKYGSDVMGISGATISAKSMTNAVNCLLKNLSKIPQ